jgi:hypothetical protein
MLIDARMAVRLLAIAGAAFSAAACASIVSGSTQEVGFRSSPEGAEVIVNGRVIGRTPVSVQLKKQGNQFVTFELDGYKKLTLPMTMHLDGWFWGNLVLGGVFGSTTDSASGAMHEYSPNQFLVTLEPVGAGKMESETLKAPRQRAREFIILAYRNIVADLKQGKGEYATSLLDSLKVAPPERPAAISRLLALAQAFPSIPEFADQAVEIFLKVDLPLQPPTDSKSDWEALKSNGSIAAVYSHLTQDEFKSAQEKTWSMSTKRRGDLQDYILDHAGKKTMTWRFNLTPGLPEGEMRFATWYLKEFSEYKPYAPIR